jgi:hypothetical protein
MDEDGRLNDADPTFGRMCPDGGLVSPLADPTETGTVSPAVQLFIEHLRTVAKVVLPAQLNLKKPLHPMAARGIREWLGDFN